MYKKILWSLIFAATLAIPAFAQQKSPFELISEDHNRAGVSAHAYEPSDTIVSPAPKGYTAFYVSHIGRHGSRYQTSASSYEFVDKFQKYAEQGCLTEFGMQLFNEIKTIKDMSEGNYGMLSKRGAREHQQIAGRLVRHYPEIFSNPDRKQVNSYDTHVKRVVASRDNFLSVVKEANPALEFNIVSPDKKDAEARERTSGRRAPSELTKEATAYKNSEEYRAQIKQATAGLKRPSSKSYIEKIFATLPADLDAKASSDLVKKIYSAGLYGRCLDLEIPAYDSLFSDEYVYYAWISTNASWYFNYCNCPQSPSRPTYTYVGKTILKHFIEDADAAIKPGSNIAADLRFSHDVKVLPFIAAVAPETCAYSGPLSNVHENVFFSKVVCMACNMQWIFYRNAKNQILVKVLQNEKEVLIPGVKAFDGPYYKWTDLRKDLLKKCVF